MIHVEGLADAPPEVYTSALQAGDYNVTVKACSPEVSRNGSPQLKFELLVEDGPMQTIEHKNRSTGEVTIEERSPVGRILFYNQTLPAASHSDGGEFCKKRLAKICEVLNVPQSDDIDENEFIGRTCKVRVKVVTTGFDGQPLSDPRNDIARWMIAE